jgi:hypothetical protein
MRTLGGWKVLVSNSQMTDGEKKFLLSLKTKLLGVEFTRNENGRRVITKPSFGTLENDKPKKCRNKKTQEAYDRITKCTISLTLKYRSKFTYK